MARSSLILYQPLPLSGPLDATVHPSSWDRCAYPWDEENSQRARCLGAAWKDRGLDWLRRIIHRRRTTDQPPPFDLPATEAALRARQEALTAARHAITNQLRAVHDDQGHGQDNADTAARLLQLEGERQRLEWEALAITNALGELHRANRPPESPFS